MITPRAASYIGESERIPTAPFGSMPKRSRRVRVKHCGPTCTSVQNHWQNDATVCRVKVPAQWHRVQLTSAEVSANLHTRIQNRFELSFTGVGSPPDMAMLSSHYKHGRTVDLYFSPATTDHAHGFLKHVHARPCEPPPLSARLQVGHPNVLTWVRSGEI